MGRAGYTFRWSKKGGGKRGKKKEKQTEFHEKLGLCLPKNATGNRNNGNSARRFFRNAEKVEEIAYQY